MSKKIVIDCGHGKNTAGKFSPIREDGTRFYEWVSNRQMGKMVFDKLKQNDVDVCFTVDPDDENDMTLKKRVEIANKIAKEHGVKDTLFISIHSDAFGMADEWYDSATGYSIFTSEGNTMSDVYAKVFEETAREMLKTHNKKVRGCYQKNFYVLKNTVCPAVLLENMFYTSKIDLEFLDSDEGRDILTDIIVKSILKIINPNN